MANENMKLWNSVCQTDPDATKKVNQRGGFTAIDAHSQIMAATEQFGPAGVGWGWDTEIMYPPNDTIAVKVILWHGEKGQTVTQHGQKNLNQSNGKADEDAIKKAVTDGLTKCLSYLGFNADVFLGKFDDNKYVERLKAEKNAGSGANDKPRFLDIEDPEELYNTMIELIRESKNVKEYSSAWKRLSLGAKRLETIMGTAKPESLDYFNQYKDDCAAHAKSIGATG